MVFGVLAQLSICAVVHLKGSNVIPSVWMANRNSQNFLRAIARATVHGRVEAWATFRQIIATGGVPAIFAGCTANVLRTLCGELALAGYDELKALAKVRLGASNPGLRVPPSLQMWTHVQV